MIFMVFTLALFFVLTSFYIWKKSQIFFLVYFVLFAYTVPTQLGYILYPEKLSEKLSIVSYYQYYVEKAFILYWIYVFLSFITIFLIFVLLYDKKYRTTFKLQTKSLLKKDRNILYIILICFYEFVLIFFLAKNYESLSYFNQAILKENKMWFYLFSFNGVVLLSIFCKLHMEHKRFTKRFYSVVFFVSLSIFLMTAIKFGQRGEVVLTLLGFVTLLWYLFRDRIRLRRLKLKYILIILGIGFIGIAFSQGVRMTRGHDVSTATVFAVSKSLKTYLSLFSLKKLIFQDWVFPSLTLMTSIQHNIVFPGKVIESNLTCLVPFISHTSLGEILSRIIEPEGVVGYGYYILTEGYNLMGFAGFLYSAFIFVFSLRLFESFFASTNDKLFNSYMFGIMGFLAITIVRSGQSMIFLKALYLYFAPAVILFMLMSKKKIYVARLKRTKRTNTEQHCSEKEKYLR